MQCVVVKSGVRCTNDSSTFAYGLTLPLVKPEVKSYICGDCIYEMYKEMTARDTTPTTQDRVRQEFV